MKKQIKNGFAILLSLLLFISLASPLAIAAHDLDIVSYNGTTTPYTMLATSVDQSSGQTGSGISNGAVVPLIPIDAKATERQLTDKDTVGDTTSKVEVRKGGEQKTIITIILDAIRSIFNK